MKLKSRDNETPQSGKLMSAVPLLETIFEKESRPSVRWLREMQRQRKIPFMKVGHLVRFDPEKVRRALDENCTIEPR